LIICDIPLNRHFLQRDHGPAPDLEKTYGALTIDQSTALQPGDLHVYIAGDEDPSEGGKTGVIHMAAPSTLALAIEFYHALKSGLFPDQAYEYDGTFFINMKEEPISMASALDKDMCAAMDVPDPTITANRHAVVTRMRQQNYQGIVAQVIQRLHRTCIIMTNESNRPCTIRAEQIRLS
jgi:hypothetical protein